MQRWEYRFVILVGIPKNLTENKGWKVKEIDEQKLPDWKQSELHSSVLLSVMRWVNKDGSLLPQ
jgi:hypothetical protein